MLYNIKYPENNLLKVHLYKVPNNNLYQKQNNLRKE